MFYKIACVILLCPGAFCAVHIPPEINRCSRSDPKFEECMRTSIIDAIKFFKNGNKDFGFPVLDPLHIERMEIEADPEKSVKLNQKYENVNMYGVSDAEVKSYRFTEDEKTCLWEMLIVSPKTRMEADYSLTGNLLVFPINGHGRCNITLYEITNKHRAACERYTKKGKSYLRLKSYAMDMSVKKCNFQFQNLIPGNEQISKEVDKTINENSLEIFQDVKGGFENMLAKLHQDGANSVLSKVPMDELFLP